MVMSRAKLDKKDTLRALLTDTLPGDVPIIFSNDGLYLNAFARNKGHHTVNNEIFESIFKTILNDSKNSQSSPFKYAINKNQFSLRTLSLIHPRAQIRFCNFYRDYSDVLLHLCSLSSFSIRAPYKVSNSYYLTEKDQSSAYKDVDIDTLEVELYRRHSSSFFSYKGVRRLHNFFESKRYIELEKSFPSLRMVDIANCFDSIYTHTVTWAVKNKEYVKRYIDFKNQFASQFDQLVQRSNNNETNGIPIGSEVSRVFAEVIFQNIDQNIERGATELGYQHGQDYVVMRYVDDFLIFSKSDDISSDLAGLVSDCLSDFNLYINDGKHKVYERPFITKKSGVISHVKRVLDDFEQKFFQKEIIDGNRRISPLKIKRVDSAYKYYVEQIKSVFVSCGGGYEDISPYLISAFSRRIIQVTSDYRSKGDDEDNLICYRDCIVLLLKLMFFYYAVHPQVSSSYKLSKTIIVVNHFISKNAPEFSNHYRTIVMQLIRDLPFDTSLISSRAKRAPLESLNVLLATSEFGSNFLLPAKVLDKFFEGTKASYFNLVALLFYVRDHCGFETLRANIELEIQNRILGTESLEKDSEAAHLFLDSLSCPYLTTSLKKKLLAHYLNKYAPTLSDDEDDMTEYLTQLAQKYWFIKWLDLDLVKLLERKELNNKY